MRLEGTHSYSGRFGEAKDIPGTHLMRLEGTHSYSGRFGEAKDLTLLPEIEQRFLGCPV